MVEMQQLPSNSLQMEKIMLNENLGFGFAKLYEENILTVEAINWND